MKKTLTRILAIVLVIGCLFTLVACAKPKLDLEKAKENLESAGYSVTYVEDSDEVGIESSLYAIEKADSFGDLDDLKHLTITKFETAKAAKLAYQAAKMNIEQEIESLKLELKTAKYTLNKFEDDLDSDEIDDYEDEIKEIKEEIEELKEQLKNIGRSGKYVWYGDKEAIKASK